MRKNTWLKIAGCLAVTSLASAAIAADHLDSPAVKLAAQADINDVYSFMDGDQAVLVMTVYPAAPVDAKFSDTTQYIFHTTSGNIFGEKAKTLDIVCTFTKEQMITCMAGEGPAMPALDRATGDAHVDAGLASEAGEMTIYAGLRKDPFYFNLAGFKKAVSVVVGAAGGLVFDATGCPTLDNGTSMALVTQLKSNDMDPPGAPEDFFATLDTLAIIVKVNKTLLTKGGPIVSTWGSTNTIK